MVSGKKQLTKDIELWVVGGNPEKMIKVRELNDAE